MRCRILILLLLVLAALYSSRNLMARFVIQGALQRATGLPVRVGEARLSPFTGQLEARHVRLANPPELVDVPLVRVDYSTISVLRGAPRCRSIEVELKELVLVKPVQGDNLAARLQSRFATGKRRSYQVDVLNVRLGTVVIQDAARPLKRLSLNQTIVFTNLTESASLPALVLRTVTGQVDTLRTP